MRRSLVCLWLVLSLGQASAQTVAIGRANMFKCPEAIASPETRVWALAAWMRYTLDGNPAAKDQPVMKVLRHRFLIAHRCTQTLRNTGG